MGGWAITLGVHPAPAMSVPLLGIPSKVGTWMLSWEIAPQRRTSTTKLPAMIPGVKVSGATALPPGGRSTMIWAPPLIAVDDSMIPSSPSGLFSRRFAVATIRHSPDSAGATSNVAAAPGPLPELTVRIPAQSPMGGPEEGREVVREAVHQERSAELARRAGNDDGDVVGDRVIADKQEIGVQHVELRRQVGTCVCWMVAVESSSVNENRPAWTQ